jgi:hypothetical protein
MLSPGSPSGSTEPPGSLPLVSTEPPGLLPLVSTEPPGSASGSGIGTSTGASVGALPLPLNAECDAVEPLRPASPTGFTMIVGVQSMGSCRTIDMLSASAHARSTGRLRTFFRTCWSPAERMIRAVACLRSRCIVARCMEESNIGMRSRVTSREREREAPTNGEEAGGGGPSVPPPADLASFTCRGRRSFSCTQLSSSTG